MTKVEVTFRPDYPKRRMYTARFHGVSLLDDMVRSCARGFGKTEDQAVANLYAEYDKAKLSAPTKRIIEVSD